MAEVYIRLDPNPNNRGHPWLPNDQPELSIHVHDGDHDCAVFESIMTLLDHSPFFAERAVDCLALAYDPSLESLAFAARMFHALLTAQGHEVELVRP